MSCRQKHDVTFENSFQNQKIFGFSWNIETGMILTFEDLKP